MSAGVAAAIAALLIPLAPIAWADTPANTTVSQKEVYEKKLLTLEPHVGLVVPTFKFYEHGELTGALIGAPTDRKPLAPAIHSNPNAFVARSLKEEMKAVGLQASSAQPQTVVIYVLNGLCPPCDRIVQNVEEQLRGLGWAGAKILVINIQ
jgi:hypothetical protein